MRLGRLAAMMTMAVWPTTACIPTTSPSPGTEDVRQQCGPQVARAFETPTLLDLTAQDIGTPTHADVVGTNALGEEHTVHTCVFRLFESDLGTAAGLDLATASKRLHLTARADADQLVLLTLPGAEPVQWVEGQSVAMLRIAEPVPPLWAALFLRLSETLTQDELRAAARAAKPGPPQVLEAVLYTESEPR